MQAQNLPLILSFPLAEEKGHIITGKGICYIEKIHGTSRVSLGRFSPFRALYSLRNIQFFYVTFEIKGNTYGCVIKDLTVEEKVVTASIPEAISPFLRKYLRVEPSRKSPVNLYVYSKHYGTMSLEARDISERGVGFFSDIPLDIENTFVCAVSLPIEDGVILLANAAVAYKKQGIKNAFARETAISRNPVMGVSYGLELFPHGEDEAKIRLYVMQREIEIRKIIQEQW